jgi:hypothetical protein
MKKIFFAAILFCFYDNAAAQFTGHTNALNVTGPQNTLKSEIPLATPSIIGSTYLDENWQKAEIVLKNGMIITDFPVKVEIEQANIEIQYDNEVKFLNIRQVDHVNLVDELNHTRRTVKKANDFTFNNVPLKGIVMIDSGELYNAIKHFYIEFLQANYNVAMDVGSKDHRKIKREKLYLAQGTRLIQIKGSNKKIVKQLGSDEEKAIALVKTHKLDLSREADLVKFVGLMKN